MQGLKCYTCSTCLFEFGAMTAIHRSPCCNRQFEYLVEKFHEKVTCTKCHKPFGFHLFDVSDRVMKQLRIDIKAEQDQRMKLRDSKMRRLARQQSKLTDAESERAFLFGLSDSCPRCGCALESLESEEEARQHLAESTDTAAIAAHKAKLQKAEVAHGEKKRRLDAQADVQAQAAWTLLGGHSEQLWLLSEEQVKAQARRVGVDDGGDKDTVLARIADATAVAEREGGNRRGAANAAKSSSLLLTDGAARSNPRSRHHSSDPDALLATQPSVADGALVSRRKVRISAASLPEGWESLGAGPLRSLCAAHGLLPLLPATPTQADMVDLIDSALFD